MDVETQAILLNAVPLLVLAALYLAIGFVLARRGAPRTAISLLFPCLGVALAILGVAVLVAGEPLAGSVWASVAAILVAAVPAVVFVATRSSRTSLSTGRDGDSSSESPRVGMERELETRGRLSRALAGAADEGDAAQLALDELAEVFELDLVCLAVVDEGGARARIVGAREGGADVEALLDEAMDLGGEAPGVGAAVRDAAAFAVFDVDSSPLVGRWLREVGRIASCAFVPVIAADGVLGVVVACVREPRHFAESELTLMQSLASETGVALVRVRSAAELEEALERERLVSRIALDVHSRQELDDLLAAAVEGVGRALDVARCFIRLGEPGEPAAVLAEWVAPGHDRLGDATRLPGVELAIQEGRTMVVADLADEVRLEDPERALAQPAGDEIRSSLVTPIISSERAIGVLGVHGPEPRRWTSGDVLLAEAVAREAAGAIQTSRLLRDSERRLAEQGALLKAGEALTSELKFDSVISRLVEELLGLVAADAADCWTLSPEGDELVCRAVLGLPESEVGRRIPVEGILGEALATGKAVLRRDFARTERPEPTASYAIFAEVMEAPIFSFGDIRGVLGVCALEHGRFDESDLRLIEAFANLASIALRNAEAYEESTRQAQVERGFYRIAAVLAEPLSASATLDAVAQAATESLGGDFSAVLRSTDGELVLAGEYGLPVSLSTFFRSGSGSGGASELEPASSSGKLLASRALRADTRFGAGLPAAAEEAGSRSLLAIPLAQPRAEGKGLVLVFFAEERVFTDEQLELAGHIAGAARGALERSELYELERRSRSLAERLASSSRELASELDPDNVLEEVVRRAAQILEASGASARIFDGDELVVRAACGTGEADALETRSASTAWLVGDIVQSRTPKAIANATHDPRALAADPMLAAGHAAYLGVPMIGPDGVVQGVLAAYDRRPRSWREEERETLALLAGSAAAARTNAELYQGVRHEQQRSEAILANVADGIVAVDREGRVVLWNRAAEQITGVPTADALGCSPAQVLGRSLEAQSTARSRGGSRLVAVRRGGEEVWLSVSEAVMTDPAGGVAGRIFAFRDISAERAVEQMKSDFVSTVSHELRTPLTSIYGFAETLLRRDVLFDEPERETFLRYIASESERLTAIVDRLLSVAQLDTGAMSVELATTDVARIVEEAVSTAETSLGQNGHTFVASVGNESLAAEADGDKLGQVLAHLIDNAVRYSPAGGTVTIAARRTDGSVEVRVEDQGVGIPLGEQERIFRKFYRGEAASQTVGGGATGLGLFLAEGLVTAMGGRIWVDSVEGRGAIFAFELPAATREISAEGR